MAVGKTPGQTAGLFLGTVQAYVARSQPYLFHPIGWAEYDRAKPILSEEDRQQAQAIVDRLNRGEITDEQAVQELEQV